MKLVSNKSDVMRSMTLWFCSYFFVAAFLLTRTNVSGSALLFSGVGTFAIAFYRARSKTR